MATYMVCDDNGNALTDGLQRHEAQTVAQRMANDRAESVWLAESDSEDLAEWLEITPDENDPIVAAKLRLDSWYTDEEEQSTINDVFHAIYERWPDEEENAVDHIYAARGVLTADEARGVLRILWSNWRGFEKTTG